MKFVTLQILLIILLFFITGTSSNQAYTIVHEKAELPFYEKDFFAENVTFAVRKINYTHVALNIKFKMATDFLDEQIKVKISIDKSSGSAYRRTGTSGTANICDAWKKNIFGIKNMILKYGYIEACQIKKGIAYYIDNFIPDTSHLPPIIPYGSYKLALNFYHENSTHTKPIFLIHWYAKIEKIVKF